MHTNIEEEALNGKASVTVISLSEEKYVYKLMKDKLYYILKGYRIQIPPLNEPGAQEAYIEVLRQLGLIYQEFYLAKIDSAFAPHYVRPLHLSTGFDAPTDREEEGTIYTEILFEHGGDSLDAYRKKGCVKLKQVYNWMRQSANALSFLHGAGISHLDIKPSNMVYDEDKDLLKIIDMGSSTSYTSQSQMFTSTKSVTSKIRELTIYYAPPEILMAYNNKALLASPISDPLEFIVGNIDVYCWAMCFYTLLLKKKDKELDNEIAKYKLQKAEEYEPFISGIEEGMKKVVTTNEEEVKLKDFILDIFQSSLQYFAKDRPKLDDVVDKMRRFDREQGVVLGYHKIEKEAQEKMNKILGLHTFVKEQEAKVSEVIEEMQKKREELEMLENNAAKIKEQLKEFEEQKSTIQDAIEIKKRELEPLEQNVEKAKEKALLEEESKALRKQLEETLAKNKELEEELIKQKSMNKSMLKKCEAYTELQLKYDEDTMRLSQEKQKIAKRLEECMKTKESAKAKDRVHKTPK